MPRYNLNQEDVSILISGLFHLSLNSQSDKEHKRITSLRNRLLNKVDLDTTSQDDDIDDVWEAFK
jgi:hypothetical protein